LGGAGWLSLNFFCNEFSSLHSIEKRLPIEQLMQLGNPDNLFTGGMRNDHHFET